MTSNKALFITIEGGEGVGKTTLINALESYLKSIGRSPILTREPGGTKLAENIRNLFVSPPDGEAITPMCELMLISAARSQHVERLIVPKLQEGFDVLCDRFTDSSLVYQGHFGGLPLDWIEMVNTKITRGLTPHLTFLLDCPVEIALQRITHRHQQSGTEKSRYDAEKISTHEKMRQGFLGIAKNSPGRFVVLDGTKSQNEIANNAILVLKERLLP